MYYVTERDLIEDVIYHIPCTIYPNSCNHVLVVEGDMMDVKGHDEFLYIFYIHIPRFTLSQPNNDLRPRAYMLKPPPPPAIYLPWSEMRHVVSSQTLPPPALSAIPQCDNLQMPPQQPHRTISSRDGWVMGGPLLKSAIFTQSQRPSQSTISPSCSGASLKADRRWNIH